MKALHIITGLGVGGAEQQLRLLLRHLPVESEVVTLTNPGPVADGLAADGVRVTHLGMAGNRDLAALPRLARIVRRGRYDLVHTHLYRACLYGRIAARLAGVRAVVATEHSLGDSQMEGRPLTAGVRALYLLGERLGRCTVAVSPTVAGRLARWGVPEPRIAVVPNGIDLTRFAYDPDARRRTRAHLGLPADAFVIGGVGRLVPGKRFDVLIRALAELPADCVLLLVGGGPEEPALRRAARAAGVAERVLFAGESPYLPDGPPGPNPPGSPPSPDLPDGSSGPRLPDGQSPPDSAPDADLPDGSYGHGLPDGPATPNGADGSRVPDLSTDGPSGPGLPALASAMDVLAAPSPEEAFGLAVVEALAAGLPVRYTSCPALEDLPPEAAPDAVRVPCDAGAYARALAEVRAAGPGPRTAPEAARHYSITRSAARLMDVYAAALARPVPPPRSPQGVSPS
ncbi:glycosyltransferase [Streptomyces tricolor]|uniref:D-inositol 3-phosphate glycosyltransferase n=1 Tax=Streptomyces tricolor TaxID=68277 RepID=A0ABS9JGF9_9ACTN|nr:glycosyltransferase [Streptomyces tricolor]MCG0064619.1 glycosyltransferase [Streptomyces tricolor]